MPPDRTATSPKPTEGKPEPVAPPLSMKELAAILVKHYGLTEGRYDLLVEFQIGAGGFGPTAESRVPSAFVGVSRVGLTVATPTSESATIVDAASINPVKPKRARKTGR